jgi:hypothetical protein
MRYQVRVIGLDVAPRYFCIEVLPAPIAATHRRFLST